MESEYIVCAELIVYHTCAFTIFGVGVFFFKQKTAYEVLISDWSSDVCSSDLRSRCSRHPTARMSRHGRRGSIWDYTAASSGGIYRVIKSASGWSLTRKGTQLRSLANGLLATDEFPPRLSSGRGLPKSLLNDSRLEGRAFERSERGRVGKGWVGTGRIRWW